MMGSVVPELDNATWFWLATIALTVIGGAGWWWFQFVNSQLRNLGERVSELEGDHVTRGDFNAGMDSIRDKLDDLRNRIDDKIDSETRSLGSRLDEIIAQIGSRRE